MKRERGQALILVLILLVVGALVTVPVLQLVNTNIKARALYGQFINEDYAADAATMYALWKLKYDPTFAADLAFGVPSDPLYVTINDVTASSTVTADASEGWMSGYALIDHQILPTKEVTPTTALPGVPTTFTYTITLERLEPDDELFDPLESVKDAMDEGFVYVPNSSELDGVPFDDDDLTILEELVIVSEVTSTPWSNISAEDSMVDQGAPTQNYSTELTMDVSSGLLGSNTTAQSFLKFDLSSFPAGADILVQSATLRLWGGSYPDVTRTYDLHLVTEDWAEGSVNWNNKPAVAATASSSTPTSSSAETQMEWSVTSDVLDWLDGVTTNYGWRISDNAEEEGTQSHTLTVKDTLEFDTLKGKTPDIIFVASNVYAIAYAGDGDDGFLTTVKVTPGGNIDTQIDTLEFDSDKGKTPSIIPISGDVYAIAYTGDGDDGFLTTVEISSTDGAITDTVIDTLEFDTQKGDTPDIIPISGDVYAIAYTGDGDDGFLTTVEISSSGAITDTVIDTLEFDTQKGDTPDIIPISGDVYAIAYAGDGDDGFLTTVEISSSGAITDTVIDTLEFDSDEGKTPSITPVSGDVYVIAYDGEAGAGSDGYLKTVEISSSGAITDTVIDTLLFDTQKGKTPDIIPISGDVYAIAYTGEDDDGFLETVAITNDGNIMDTLTYIPEFDASKGTDFDIIHIAGNDFAVAYAGDGDDGFLKTLNLLEESDVEHITVFHTMNDGDPGGSEPVLTIIYSVLGSVETQTIEWRFEPDLDFTYGQERTLSFRATASLPDNSSFWNAARVLPNFGYTGLVAPITVGDPPDTGVPGVGAIVTKTADPEIVYAGIPTIVTYVISITNGDIGDFGKLDFIEDYLPPGFSYVLGSATWEWPDDNSTDNPAYQTYSQYYNIGDFEPAFKDDPSGRLVLKWHRKASANGLFPGDNELLHDRPFPAGVTYTQTFQALAEVEVSGNYPNEVFVKLKDWGLYGDRGLGDLKEVYSWPTGEVVVPAYDILTETEHSILRANAAITVAGIEIRSWHWKKHK